MPNTMSQSFQCLSFRSRRPVWFPHRLAMASDAASPRSRSHSAVFRDYNVEIVPMSGDPIRILVDVDGSMGQIMSRVAKVVGSTEGRRIERIGCLVLLGTETIERFQCWHAFTRVMQTKSVRAMLDLDQIVRFQLVIDETLDVRRSDD